ncbi:MAG: MFS transporter [Thermoplasmata archaeon]
MNDSNPVESNISNKESIISSPPENAASTNKEKLENSNQKIPWAALVALGMGMLVYGVAESYGPVSAITGVIPSNLAFLGYSLPFIAGGVGAFIAGFMADYMGRKVSFMVTIGMLLVGLIIYVLASSNVVALMISFILVGMSAIGLESPILTMMAEQASAKSRGSLLVITQNFGNVGVAIVFIPIMLGLSKYQDIVAISLMFIGPLVALVVAWLLVEESIPWGAVKHKVDIGINEAWKEKDGNAELVEPKGGLFQRFLILIIIGIAQDVGFVYITYGVSYAYFSAIASEVPLIGGFTMVIVGIIAALWVVPKVDRKTFATVSYALQLILWIGLWIFEDLTGSKAGFALLAIMTILFVPVEITWGVRAILEPELFATAKRGIYISTVRMVVWVSAGVINGILLSGIFSIAFNSAMAVITVIFLIGLAAALMWHSKGFETKDKSLAGLD